jgi:hypothetical protein
LGAVAQQGVTKMADQSKQHKQQPNPAHNPSLVPTTGKDEMLELSHPEETNTPNPEKIDGTDTGVSESIPLELARRTIRLEQAIDERLEQLCRSERITRDTFIEAVYLICREDAKLRQQIVTIAKDRYEDRKRLGDQRKFATMAEKYRKIRLIFTGNS